MSTAEFAGLALQVLTSTMTLFLTANARPHAHPPVFASCWVEIVLSGPLSSDIGATIHCVLDWVWAYWWHAGQRIPDAMKKVRACLAVGNSTTACSA